MGSIDHYGLTDIIKEPLQLPQLKQKSSRNHMLGGNHEHTPSGLHEGPPSHFRTTEGQS